MTRNQRRQYLTLHVVRELCRGMKEHGNIPDKSRKSIDRIINKANGLMAGLGTVTPADARHFYRAAEKLRKDDQEYVSQAAFVGIALASVADTVRDIPQKATARAEYEQLEGMLFTLYRHFDPSVEDNEAADTGEAIAQEYRALVA